jgi:hypothetical protein
VSFSVLVCLSVLTMSFLAPCADSAHLPGMLTCHAVLLSLLKKSGKVFVTLFPRFPPPWPALLWCLVFDAIKIATSLMVCFLQRQFHHRWQNHGTVFLTKIELESPRSSASVLSLNTPAVPHQIQAIILKNCSSGSRLSLFQHGHPNGWSWSTMTGKSVQQWTISNPHLLMTTPSESMPWACVQACTPLKLSSCCKYKVYYTYITESFLWQPSLHAISTLTSLFRGLIDTNMEPATQAWFKKPTLCSLSHGKEKNTSESLEIQRGLHDISILITLFLLMTLKPTMIDLPDYLHYLTFWAYQGCPQAICNAASFLVWWPVYFWHESSETVYCLCAWMLLQPIHMPVKILVFIYK